VHVATALGASCDDFLTWDGSSGKRYNILKVAPELKRMGLTVCPLTDTKFIPDDYRQQPLGIAEDGTEKP